MRLLGGAQPGEKARLDVTAPPVKHLVGVRFGADGVEVEELTAAKGVTLSNVAEKDGKLWLGRWSSTTSD